MRHRHHSSSGRAPRRRVASRVRRFARSCAPPLAPIASRRGFPTRGLPLPCQRRANRREAATSLPGAHCFFAGCRNQRVRQEHKQAQGAATNEHVCFLPRSVSSLSEVSEVSEVSEGAAGLDARGWSSTGRAPRGRGVGARRRDQRATLPPARTSRWHPLDALRGCQPLPDQPGL